MGLGRQERRRLLCAIVTAVELALFKHALDNLDVIYAHKHMASLLSTVAPDGVQLDRDY